MRYINPHKRSGGVRLYSEFLALGNHQVTGSKRIFYIGLYPKEKVIPLGNTLLQKGSVTVTSIVLDAHTVHTVQIHSQARNRVYQRVGTPSFMLR